MGRVKYTVTVQQQRTYEQTHAQKEPQSDDQAVAVLPKSVRPTGCLREKSRKEQRALHRAPPNRMVVVTRCLLDVCHAECPFCYEETERCTHPDAPKYDDSPSNSVEVGPPPSWCPLRKKPTLVRLDQK